MLKLNDFRQMGASSPDISQHFRRPIGAQRPKLAPGHWAFRTGAAFDACVARLNLGDNPLHTPTTTSSALTTA